MVKTNTVGGLISLKCLPPPHPPPKKKAKGRDLQQMMTRPRMRSDYADGTQWISELWRLITGISQELDIFFGKRVMGRQTGRAQYVLRKRKKLRTG